MDCHPVRVLPFVSPLRIVPAEDVLIFAFRLRQYPLYSKAAPPPALAKDFEPGAFEKSQAYGKDKAKFALFSGIYKQAVDSSLLQFGFYSWSWTAAGSLIHKFGYTPQYQVRVCSFCLTR